MYLYVFPLQVNDLKTENMCSDMNNIVVRAHIFSSLKAKATYIVYVSFKASGDVAAASCKCVAGKEEACSHVAALLFYMEDFICQQNAGDSMLTSIPEDRTATDELQH